MIELTHLLGKRIKELRERIGMSQRDACKGICTQAYISKIENGVIYPSAYLLMELSNRFNTDISYLLDISNTPSHEYIIEVFTQIREAIYQRDYSLVRELLNSVKDNDIFQVPEHKQFLLWHEGICLYYEDHNFPDAIDYLNKSLSITSSEKKFLSEREIEILLSKANIYTDKGEYSVALSIYEEAFIQQRSIPNITNKYLPVRFFYNYARALRLNKDYEQSLEMVDKGIQYAKKNNLLYLQGDLFYQKGANYKALNLIEKAIENFNLAEMAYRIEDNLTSLNLVESMKEELSKNTVKKE